MFATLYDRSHAIPPSPVRARQPEASSTRSYEDATHTQGIEKHETRAPGTLCPATHQRAAGASSRAAAGQVWDSQNAGQPCQTTVASVQGSCFIVRTCACTAVSGDTANILLFSYIGSYEGADMFRVRYLARNLTQVKYGSQKHACDTSNMKIQFDRCQSVQLTRRWRQQQIMQVISCELFQPHGKARGRLNSPSTTMCSY